MHVLVIGAGVTGLLTAWYLRKEGHEVTVVDQDKGPAFGASYANGAQLSYSYVAPLAGPGVLPKVPPWLLRSDSPLRLRPSADWRQWRWLVQFVNACNAGQSDLTTRRLLKLAFHSRDLMHAFLCSAPGRGVSFGHSTNGKLVVFSDDRSFASARRLVEYQRTLGCEQRILDREECRAIEPALTDNRSNLGQRMVGGVHTPSEEVGDCYSFCVGVERLLGEAGVALEYGFQVDALKKCGGRLAAVAGQAGEIGADAFVLACGTESSRLAAAVGIYLPIYPLKGYSLTFPAGASAPAISVTDFERKVVYSPLNAHGARNEGKLRVAGLADLVGHQTRIDPRRFGVLLREACKAFPRASEEGLRRTGNVRPWAGLRPATPRGTPILGQSPIANLFLNTGHGALGWTLGHGCAQIVSDVVCGRTPAIPLEGFRP